MNINRENYEAFLLDRLEGRLSAHDERQLQLFLETNPDCAVDLPDELLPVLHPGEIEFPNGEKLKFDKLCFARLEGELNEEGIRVHEKAMAENKKFGAEWLLWQNTRLLPDEVVFKEKHKIKKHKTHKYRVINPVIIAVAAAIALLAGFFIIVPLPGDVENTRTSGLVVENSQIPKPEIEGLAKENLKLAASGIESGISLEEPAYASAAVVPVPEIRDFSEDDIIQKAGPGTPREEGLKASHLKVDDWWSDSQGVTAVRRDRIASLNLPAMPLSASRDPFFRFRNRESREILQQLGNREDLALFNLAEASVKGINKLTGSEMSISASRNEDGSISSYSFSSRILSVSRKTNKP